MTLSPAKEQAIREVFQRFLRSRVQTIRRLQIDELHINPFLIRILAKEMGWSDARAIVRWLVNQRLERGLVTSFGIALQEAAKVFSEGTGVEGADILKSKGGFGNLSLTIRTASTRSIGSPPKWGTHSAMSRDKAFRRFWRPRSRSWLRSLYSYMAKPARECGRICWCGTREGCDELYRA